MLPPREATAESVRDPADNINVSPAVPLMGADGGEGEALKGVYGAQEGADDSPEEEAFMEQL